MFHQDFSLINNFTSNNINLKHYNEKFFNKYNTNMKSMLEKLKNMKKNYLKMNILFLFVIISNIILLVGLFYHYSKLGFQIDVALIEKISTFIAIVSILSYITLKLPKLRERGGSLYDMGYILIICIIGIMTSYFDEMIDTPILFGSYLDMFRVLCVVLIFLLLSVHLKPIKEVINRKFTRKNQIVCIIIFSLIGIFASHYHILIHDAPANIRCLIVMISGLFGGPVVGIPVGIITGAYRFTLGGVTALPCAISTVISGIIGSLIFIWNDKKFPKITTGIALMFLFTGFEMLLVLLLTPPKISLSFIGDLYPYMLFASIIGIILFTIVFKETKVKMDTESKEELEIEEIEIKLKEYDKKIEELENEIRELKKEN